MEKFIELVELETGEIVAIGPFVKREKAAEFAEHIESYESRLPIAGSRGGVRLMTVDALAYELGAKPSALKP